MKLSSKLIQLACLFISLMPVGFAAQRATLDRATLQKFTAMAESHSKAGREIQENTQKTRPSYSLSHLTPQEFAKLSPLLQQLLIEDEEKRLNAIESQHQEQLNQSVSDQRSQLSLFRDGECNDGDPTCVTQCIRRDSNGNCSNYGSDFCGNNASCAVQCLSRSSNGSCSTYATDFCGSNATCAVQCISRSSNGSCSTYGQDFCGTKAKCAKNCTSRSSNGSCSTYGTDVCTRN